MWTAIMDDVTYVSDLWLGPLEHREWLWLAGFHFCAWWRHECPATSSWPPSIFCWYISWCGKWQNILCFNAYMSLIEKKMSGELLKQLDQPSTHHSWNERSCTHCINSYTLYRLINPSTWTEVHILPSHTWASHSHLVTCVIHQVNAFCYFEIHPVMEKWIIRFTLCRQDFLQVGLMAVRLAEDLARSNATCSSSRKVGLHFIIARFKNSAKKKKQTLGLHLLYTRSHL